jgi:predicted ribosomally synthesized peptide with SipW-like signal peptide
MAERSDSKARRIVLSVLIVGVVGALVGVGTLSAFSSSTSNSGNNFDAGTVVVSDNDGGVSAMYSVTNRKPGQSVQSCIKVTYGGSLAADVRLYTTSTINAVGQYIDLTVEKGTSAGGPAFPGCGVFTSEATVYSGTLSNFAGNKNSYANGVSAYPGAQTAWNQNDTLVYRFTLTLQDDNNANGQGAGAMQSGAHSFTWEARNQ